MRLVVHAPGEVVDAADAPRAAPLARRLADVDDAGGVVEAVARPAVLLAELLEAERRAVRKLAVAAASRSQSARRSRPRIWRSTGTGLPSHGVEAARAGLVGSTSATLQAVRIDERQHRVAEARLDRRDRDAVLLERVRPVTRGCPPALRATPRPRGRGPSRGGAICAHGKNVRSVPGWPSASA